MDYREHYHRIKSIYPNLDLIKDSEFDLFHDISLATETVKLCIELSESASRKLDINLCFGVEYLHSANASAKIKNDSPVIIFNIGLIDKLDDIVSDSVKLFMCENIARFTVPKNEIHNLESRIKQSCIAYLFYHELGHIIQLMDLKSDYDLYFQELYSHVDSFDIKKHIYEMDADNFGAVMSAYTLLETASDGDYKFRPVPLFNELSLLLFSLANIIIEFSGNLFNNIYYKANSHPHPYIRIVKCHEQIIFFVSDNLKVSAAFSEAVLERTGGIISKIKYSENRRLDFGVFFTENQEQLLRYIDEIENLYDDFQELITHKVQDICNKLIY